MKSSALRHPARLAGASLLRLQSDERLAELASSGHESAFDAIVDRYRTPLLRYCTGIVGPSRAEDAVQQALINAHDALQRTDDVRNLRSWLYRIAHNAALNVLRAVRDDVPLDDHESAAAATAGPAESFERSEQFRSTLAALQALPERQRAALVLRELEGRSHEEIAAALGVTKGSARQHLMRARVAVRTAVTAVTPYPLVVRLADWASAGAAGGSGWVDAAATAGAGASLAKLTAGLAATGALVGGAAVGTEHVVHGGSGAGVSAGAAELPRAAERSAERVVKQASEVVAAAPAAAAGTPTPATRTSASTKPSSPSPRRERRSAPRDGGVRAKANAPMSSPAAPVAPVTSHRGRDDADSRDDDRHSERGRDHDTAPRHGRREKDDDKREPSGHGRSNDRSPSSAPATSHRSDKDDGANASDGESSSGKPSSNAGSGSGSSESSGRGSGSGSSPTTTTDSDSETSPGKTTTAETPTTTTTTTSPVDTDDEG